ncbi:MAG: hypothetical protein WCS73_07210, partial [Lentisphaeria bacterium]
NLAFIVSSGKRKWPAATLQRHTGHFQVLSGNQLCSVFQRWGSSVSISAMPVFASLGRISVSQASKSTALSLQVATRLLITAAISPPFSLPTNNQFFRPSAQGRMVFSAGYAHMSITGLMRRIFLSSSFMIYCVFLVFSS